MEKELREIIEDGHDYDSCDMGNIDLDYVLVERKCKLCLLSIIAKNL